MPAPPRSETLLRWSLGILGALVVSSIIGAITLLMQLSSLETLVTIKFEQIERRLDKFEERQSRMEDRLNGRPK